MLSESPHVGHPKTSFTGEEGKVNAPGDTDDPKVVVLALGT